MSQTQADLADGTVAFREARREDLPAVVRLLANDSLGTWRESLGEGELPEAYGKAFDAIAADPRNQIIVGERDGRALIEHAVGLARRRCCALVQLTTDKRRPEALAFYQALGFVASHEGMKLKL